ncbi:DUF397 domain-containing protein [Saccharopolyspora sp. NPDC050389]|uniref:DUF397 domain-containing protein n=1 Tax=Saccharopolyspora sp. NPDC050389 TaxID=3155516 RepID=UPI003410BC54
MSGQFEVPVSAIGSVTWQKSRHSGKWGNCVEVAALDDGTIAMRQSRQAHGTALIYTRAELAAFVRGVKDGEFDDLVS